MRPPEGLHAGMDGAAAHGRQRAGVLDRRSGVMCGDWRGDGSGGGGEQGYSWSSRKNPSFQKWRGGREQFLKSALRTDVGTAVTLRRTS
jgi:hypothetical protein